MKFVVSFHVPFQQCKSSFSESLRRVTVNVARFLIEQVDKYQCLQTGNSTAHHSSNADLRSK
jgi:hypothetical protein